MKHILTITIWVLFAGTLFFISCKKELSCAGCGDNNKAPIAVAGPDKLIPLPADSILLDGSASSDPDGTISSFLWTTISGPASITIANPTIAITGVKNLVAGVYQFELKVTDAGGLFSKDTMQVTVSPAPSSPTSNCDPGVRPLVQAQLIPIGTLSQTRANITISAAGNKILFAGGSSPQGCGSSRVDIYTISTNSWTTAELSQARYDIGVAALGNKIFFGGGFTPKNFTNSTTCYIGNNWYPETRSSAIDIYDVSANTWNVAELSSPRVPQGASAGNKIIFAGGNALSGIAWPSNVTDIYNAIASSWTPGSLSEEKGLPQIATIGNKIYLAGGARILDGDYWGGISNRIDIYDALSDSWSVDYLSRERAEMGAISANNKIYWAGGYIISANPVLGYESTSLVEIRDLVTNTTSFDCLSEPKTELTAIRKDNKIIFFGGSNAKFDIYDLTTNSWSIGVLPQNLRWSSVISHNNIIYVAGGEVNGNISNQVWKLEF